MDSSIDNDPRRCYLDLTALSSDEFDIFPIWFNKMKPSPSGHKGLIDEQDTLKWMRNSTGLQLNDEIKVSDRAYLEGRRMRVWIQSQPEEDQNGYPSIFQRRCHPDFVGVSIDGMLLPSINYIHLQCSIRVFEVNVCLDLSTIPFFEAWVCNFAFPFLRAERTAGSQSLLLSSHLLDVSFDRVARKF